MIKHLCIASVLKLGICTVVALSSAVESMDIHNQIFFTSQRDTAYLDSVANYYMTTYHAPGLTDLIMKDGEIIWIGHYGFANIEQQLPPNDSTSWDVGSVTKTVTAVAAMKAWEDGLYGLDDDINDSLPFTVTNPHYPDDSITPRMLLTHTSSIANVDMYYQYSWYGDPFTQLDTLLYNYLNPAGYWYSPSNFIPILPGSQCTYSNIAIGLAGYFAQVVTGDSLPLYCRQHIFEPLGMNHTSWWFSELDTNNVAVQYEYVGGQYARIGSGRVSHSDYPAGQLKSSAIDLSRFLLAFMQYGRLDTVRILDSTTVALMQTIQDTIIQGPFVCPIGITWWRWYSISTGSQVWGHAGRDYGAAAIMAYYEDFDIGVIIMTNGDNLCPIEQLMAGMVPALVQWALQHGIAENTIEPAHIIKLDVTPNPFTHIMDIRYQITDDGTKNNEVDIGIRIYDASGRLIKDLGRSSVIGHPLSVKWNGTDHANRPLGSGVYFVKLRTDDCTETRKVLLVR